MKLDLIEIRKLSPVGLWDLAELAAYISTLMNVIAGGFGGAACVRLSARMLAQYRKQLAVRRLDNFNMRVKAWVLQCPERIAYVRGIIGEGAIKRWNKNRLLDYAFTKAFGDWKSAFPNGLKRKNEKQKQITRCKSQSGIRPYRWQFFALVKIPNAARILYGQKTSKLAKDSAQKAEVEEQRAAYLKLWGVDIMDTFGREKTTQPRRPRPMNPVRFTPSELVAEAATGVQGDMIEEGQKLKLTNVERVNFPLLKIEEKPDKSSRKPTEFKPP